MTPREAIASFRPTRAEFDGLVAGALEWVDASLKDHPADFCPKLVIGYREGEVGPLQRAAVVVPEGFADDTEKRLSLKKLGKEFYENKLLPVVVILAMDSWMVSGKKGQEEEILRVRPSEHPDRCEAITVVGQSVAREYQVQAVNRYTRDVLGCIVPGAWDGPHELSKDSTTNILDHFWRGFVAPVAVRLN